MISAKTGKDIDRSKGKSGIWSQDDGPYIVPRLDQLEDSVFRLHEEYRNSNFSSSDVERKSGKKGIG